MSSAHAFVEAANQHQQIVARGVDPDCELHDGAIELAGALNGAGRRQLSLRLPEAGSSSFSTDWKRPINESENRRDRQPDRQEQDQPAQPLEQDEAERLAHDVPWEIKLEPGDHQRPRYKSEAQPSLEESPTEPWVKPGVNGSVNEADEQ